MKLAAAILAGGRATRLRGRFKPTLIVAGRAILDRQLSVLDRLVDDIFFITQDGAAPAGISPRAHVVADVHPGRGPLAGLESALTYARTPHVLLLGGDMPALDPAALALLLDAPTEHDVVVPDVAGALQVLHARYARALLPAIRERLNGPHRSLQGFVERHPSVLRLDEATLRAADPSLLTLANVNTPEELSELDAALREREGT